MGEGKALVMGDDTRSFLAIVRSLGRRGIDVHVAPSDFTSPALTSRYISRVHYLPPWPVSEAGWNDALETLLRTEHFDLVIPSSDLTLLPLQKQRERFGALAKLAIPDDRSIAALFDKQATRELAQSVGAPVAAGGPALSTDDAGEVFARLGSPVVLKPRRSYAVENLEVRGQVRICESPAALQALLPRIREGEYFYEAFFPGRGAGVSVLASRGRILQAFEHHRVREDQSGSYYRVSVAPTPALHACCAAMVAALDYTGIAMFEFRLGPVANEWILLEVNARPWGSMPLPVSLGVDFPYRWYQLLVNGTETPPVAYRAGMYGRNLVPDLYSTMADMKARWAAAPVVAARRVGEIGRVLAGRERQDTLVLDDAAPGLRELRSLGAGVAGRLARAGRLERLVPARRYFVHSATQRRLRRALEAEGNGPITLVMVCQGNICRSPFAAAMLEQALREQALAGSGAGGGAAGRNIVVRSAGLLPRSGRRTPQFGIEAAGALGVDLQAHRSMFLSREDAEAASAILIFDDVNQQWIARRYPRLATAVVKLGHFAPLDDWIDDIADPIDRDLAFYTSTYDAIARSAAGLAAIVEAALR